jgi:G3E family GTPase
MIPQDITHAPLPVTIVTGFLGAGKTTLLNRLLSGRHGMRLAVIVNDFGAINIDARLVDVVNDDTISLANGCVCCSMRGTLVTTALGVLGRPNSPQHLVVEASGIADPASIAGAFHTSALRDRTRLNAIIALVDAENARNPRLDAQLIREQIRTADLIVLNKADLVSAKTRVELAGWIRSLAPRARIVPAVQADVPADLILGGGESGFEVKPFGEAHLHDHGGAYESWNYRTDRPLAYRAVRGALEGLPPEVFRAKGTLALADAPNIRFVAHVVGRRVSIEPDASWGERTPRTEIVLIGSPGAMTEEDVVARLDACATASFILMSPENFASVKRRTGQRRAGPGPVAGPGRLGLQAVQEEIVRLADRAAVEGEDCRGVCEGGDRQTDQQGRRIAEVQEPLQGELRRQNASGHPERRHDRRPECPPHGGR